MTIASTLLVALIIGMVIGAVARLFVPDPRPGTLTVTIALGAVGAVAAAVVGHLDGWFGPGHASLFLASMLGALCLLTGYRLISDEITRMRGVSATHIARVGDAP